MSKISRYHISRANGLKDGRDANRLLFNSVLSSAAAASSSSLPLVCAVHCRILKSGSLDVVFATAMVDAFGRCSELRTARKLFDEMTHRDIPAWNAMLSGYNRNGDLQQALALVRLMFLSAVRPNSVTCSILLQLCSNHGDKSLGRCVHGYLWRHPGIGDNFLYNSLLVYYHNLGHVHIAESLFEEMERRNIVTWNAMMAGYIMNNRPKQALEMFHHLRQEGLRLGLVTLETALHACARVGEEAMVDGQLIHTLFVRMGIPADVYTENSLLLMYCQCGSLHLAQHLFNMMASRNIVSWNILMNGYVRKPLPERAVTLFRSALSILPRLSSDLMVGALRAVKQLHPCPEFVMCYHGLVVVLGFTSDEFVASSLISAYGEHMDVANARRCFDYVFPGNGTTVLWNTLLSVYLHSGYLLEAVEILPLMRNECAMADAVTLVIALSICAQLQDIKLGKAVHGYAVRNNFEGNSFVISSLLEFYSRCLLMSKAWWLFLRIPLRTTTAWNTMIFGCSQNGSPRASLLLFHMMQQLEDVKVDATTVVGVVEAIGQRGYEREGDYIHRYAIEKGFLSNEFVANSLISMYWQFGDLGKANEVFNGGSGHSRATWNAMIAKYSDHGFSETAVSVFHLMKVNNMRPDEINLLSVLLACAKLASLRCAMWVHTNIMKVGCDCDVFVSTSLSDTYAKCGELPVARLIFDDMKLRTTASWNSMIRAYGMHGDVEEAGKLFHKMLSCGIEPDFITFLVLISSCDHAGEVDKGLGYHNLMTNVYSLSPKMEHYSCIVDLLGRKGMINEAFEFLQKIPLIPGTCAWGSLLMACRAEGKIDIALAAAKRLFKLDPFSFGYHTLLCSILSESGRRVDAFEIKNKLSLIPQKNRNMQGLSIVEV
ncbi:unnamed protein product [Spirodela intermedia]|uniref:Uncharacterized protein n=1 Tax=Spirodela intermedia TaxID=51605 RepID=A0A7I8KAY3_SPIIN|nr:unnamed protein product [Spirodela intermedia]